MNQPKGSGELSRLESIVWQIVGAFLTQIALAIGFYLGSR